MQTEILFLIDLLWLDHPTNETLYLGDKPNENECVNHIEGSMESCQYKTQLSGISQVNTRLDRLLYHRHVVTYPTAYHIDERTEHE